MNIFDTTKNPLQTMIKQISEGKIQLPDFQRGWVWDDQHVRSLLVSVARSLPILIGILCSISVRRKKNAKLSIFHVIKFLTPMLGRKAYRNMLPIYLADIQNHKQVSLSDEKMNETLKSHCIDPEALRSDDYALFTERRREKRIQIVERAMGKTIERESRDFSLDVQEDASQLQEDAV